MNHFPHHAFSCPPFFTTPPSYTSLFYALLIGQSVHGFKAVIIQNHELNRKNWKGKFGHGFLKVHEKYTQQKFIKLYLLNVLNS